VKRSPDQRASVITDDQIRELRADNLASPRVSELTAPQGTSRTAWRLAIETDSVLALGIIPDSPALSERSNRACQDAARDRCAEYYHQLRTARSSCD
jgi:hypothetical protein